MLEIILVPHEGIVIQNIGKVCFEQTPEEVEKILGAPSTRLLSYYHNGLLRFYNPDYREFLPAGIAYAGDIQFFYNDYEIRIDFNDSKKVEFIECIAGPFPDKATPFIYDREVFSLSADELMELLTDKNNGAVDIESVEKICSFLEIDVGIFRELTEIEAEKSIEVGKADGTYETNRKSYEQDLMKARHFWTIGIGDKGYYRKVKEEVERLWCNKI